MAEGAISPQDISPRPLPSRHERGEIDVGVADGNADPLARLGAGMAPLLRDMGVTGLLGLGIAPASNRSRRHTP
jgi:hypothetical protein